MSPSHLCPVPAQRLRQKLPQAGAERWTQHWRCSESRFLDSCAQSGGDVNPVLDFSRLVLTLCFLLVTAVWTRTGNF